MVTLNVKHSIPNSIVGYQIFSIFKFGILPHIKGVLKSLGCVRSFVCGVFMFVTMFMNETKNINLATRLLIFTLLDRKTTKDTKMYIPH